MEWRVGIFVTTDDVIEVCGAYANKGTVANEHHYSILRGLGVAMNGRTILTDLTYFSRAPNMNALDGFLANCRTTGVTAPDGPREYEVIDVGRSRKVFSG